MADDPIRRELETLRRRVEALEARLAQLTGEPVAAPPTTPPHTPPTAPLTVPPPLRPAAPPPIAPAPAPTPPTTPPTTATPSKAPPTVPAPAPTPALAAHLRSFRDETRPQPAAAASPRVSASPQEDRERAGALEMLIGGRIAAWAGAIVIVIAAALLIMLGIEEGWWNRLSPTVRCLLVAALGLALLGGGEVALRRISRPASVGLFGGGLGVLYLDALATFKVFDLLAQEWAFVLTAAVALFAFAVTLRTRFLTIGVLGLVGGYATPILLGGGGGHQLEVGVYLTVLLATALGLSGARPAPYRPLRYVALGGQALLGLLWVIDGGAGLWLASAIFLSIWWSMVLAESVIAALRGQSTLGNPFAVVLASAAYVTAGGWILNAWAPAGPDWLGAFTVAVALLSGAAAFQFGPGLETLRGRLLTPMDKLAVVLWAQAGVLLATAVALQFDDFGQSIGWLAIGVAAIEIGRRLRSRGMDVFGLVVGALALCRIACVDWWVTPTMQAVRWSGAGITITNWSLLMLVAIVAVHVSAHRLRPASQALWRRLPAVLAAIGSVMWFGLVLAQCEESTITAGILLGAVVLIALERFGRRQRYLEIALLLLFVGASWWLLVDAIGSRLVPTWDPLAQPPIVNTQMGLALAIAVVGGWGARRLWRRQADAGDRVVTDAGSAWSALIIVGVVFLLLALSFEVDRFVLTLAARAGGVGWSAGQVRQLMLTILWSLGALGLGLLGRFLRPAGADLVAAAAWFVLGACGAKWLLVDTFYWTAIADHPGALALGAVINVQMTAALVLAGVAVLLWSLRTGPAGAAAWAELAAWAPVAAAVVVLWGLSFEVDRLVDRAHAAPGGALIDPLMHRALWWTALWGAGGFAMSLWWERPRLRRLVDAGWAILLGAAVVWLLVDTLAFRMAQGPAPMRIVLNLQFLVGALLLVMIVVGAAIVRRCPDEHPIAGMRPPALARVAFAFVALIGLGLGSVEIDRYSDPTAAQAGLSIYWALYGVALVVLGFARRIAAARHAGLALLAITLGKVLLVDLATIHKTWRVISVLASGILLVATSMLYYRLSPRLLKGEERD